MRYTRARMKMLLPKSSLRFGTWSVCSMHKPGRCGQKCKGDEEIQLKYSWSKRDELKYL